MTAAAEAPTLAAQLSATKAHISESAPAPLVAIMETAVASHIESFDRAAVIAPGSRFPSFSLPDATGKATTLETLFSTPLPGDGSMVPRAILVTFYRGTWCPYCNVALRSLLSAAGEFSGSARNVALVAISPELPPSQQQRLTHPDENTTPWPSPETGFAAVLSDAGNDLARRLGIVWRQPDELRAVYAAFGTDLARRNGDDSFEVPVPASFLVDRKGVVRNVFVEPDYRKRLDPKTALEWADALDANRGGVRDEALERSEEKAAASGAPIGSCDN